MANEEMHDTYTQMWREALACYQNNLFEYDEHLNGLEDRRRGVTLLARLNPHVSAEITTFLQAFCELDRRQYVYPDSDFHITVMSIVSCRNGYDLGSDDADKYVEFIQHIVERFNVFAVELTGLTASPSCTMIKGSTDNQTLQNIRRALRDGFINSDLEHTMDSRYTIKTAHSTVIRYRQPIRNHLRLIQFLQHNATRKFGTTLVESLELVFNDWYQSHRHTKLLGTFKLIPAR